MTPLQRMALQAANIADKLIWASRQREIDGRKVVIVPVEEAEEMKDELLAISHMLNDIQDARHFNK